MATAEFDSTSMSCGRGSTCSIHRTPARRSASASARARISSPTSGVSGALGRSTSWMSGSKRSAALSSRSIPFWRVIRPTKVT